MSIPIPPYDDPTDDDDQARDQDPVDNPATPDPTVPTRDDVMQGLAGDEQPAQ